MLLVLALRTDPVVLAAGLAWTGLVLAWGWPRLLGSSSRFGSSLAVGVTAVLAPAAAVVSTDEPYLRLVPVALAVGLGLMFVHQIVRRDGRPRLTESIGVTSFGLALVAVGTTWLPLARSSRPADLATVALVAVAVGSLADLAAGMRAIRPWLLPLAMVLGASGAVVTAALLGAPRPATAALAGLLAAAVSHAMRRVLVVLPPITAVRCQLTSAAAASARAGRRRVRRLARPRRLTRARPARASVDERPRPGGHDLLDEGRRPADDGARDEVVLPEVAACRALAAHGDPSALEEGVAQLRERARRAGARPPRRGPARPSTWRRR